MPQPFKQYEKKYRLPEFYKLYHPSVNILTETPALKSQGYIPLKMSFEDELKALIFYRIERAYFGPLSCLSS
ncbi:MAG: hypothetical protein ABIK92_19180 [Pseudomonadota bacterium]